MANRDRPGSLHRVRTCAFTAPDIFDAGDAGRAVMIGPVAAGDERVRVAVRHCPTSALRLAGQDER